MKIEIVLNTKFETYTAPEVSEILQEIAEGLQDKQYFEFTKVAKMPLLDIAGKVCGYVRTAE